MNNVQPERQLPPPALTKAELAVLALVDAGLSNQQIAARLSIAVGTVKCHLHRVYEKLQVRNRTQAAMRAREHQQFIAVSAGRRDNMNSVR